MTPAQRMMRRTTQAAPALAPARAGSARLLISVNVLGSAGPIRFVVKEEEPVGAVISTALRSYAREGRRPILGSDLNNFLLYCTNSCSDGMRVFSLDDFGWGFEFLVDLMIVLDYSVEPIGAHWQRREQELHIVQETRGGGGWEFAASDQEGEWKMEGLD